MSNISKSPDRFSFQKEKYIERQTANSEPISEDYLDMFETFEKHHASRFNDPKNRENNLEYDLLTTDWILEKVRSSDTYAQNVYASLCNMQWRSKKMWPALKEQNWSCSWRYAGGIVADMQGKGDYIDWYCSGIYNTYDISEEKRKENHDDYVSEGTVTDEIRDDFDRLGWIPIPYED
jgi:hypothetical protein